LFGINRFALISVRLVIFNTREYRLLEGRASLTLDVATPAGGHFTQQLTSTPPGPGSPDVEVAPGYADDALGKSRPGNKDSLGEGLGSKLTPPQRFISTLKIING
jgi:hypothetical protein